ncbi:hypothetical protein B0H19DRAFT_1228187 [Mycena capillaripes]|nr:hypothetical protein B0H19DRAFT_1228187 [Mycena capillaripes]
MHRCLQIPELVALFCSHVYPPGELETSFDVRHPRRRDLAVLARTSTMFSSHALKLLWKSVALIQLLRCLPSDSFNLTTTGEGYFTKYIMELLRPIRASDWQRVLVYAPHVKQLYSDSDFADLSTVFPSLSAYLPKSMLPNLLGVHWIHGGNEFQYINSFLTPQLTTIRIPHASHAALSLLPSLALRCPQLTQITFFPRTASDFGPLAVSAVSACVRGLRYIETLTADMVDQPALEHLSRLSTLRHLRLGDLPPTLPVLPTDDQALCPSLQTVYFSSEILSPTRFLEWGNKLPLVEFIVECPAFSTADEVHRLFTTAAGGMSHSSLTDFSFANDFGSFAPTDPKTYLIRPQSLRSLFCFSNLASVSVLSAVGIDLDDTTVTDMARSWRQIQRLEFQSYYGNAAPRTTLRCLEAFAKYCPHLAKLSISFDATVFPTSPADFTLGCLTHLDVEASPISRALPVARILAHIFPSLGNISTLRDSLDGDTDWEAEVGPAALQYDRQWKHVASILERTMALNARWID